MGARSAVVAVGVLGAVVGAGLLLVAPEEPGRTAALAVSTAVAVIVAAVRGRQGAGAPARASWVLLALAGAGLAAWSAVAGGWAGRGPALLVAGAVVAGGAVLARRARPTTSRPDGAEGGPADRAGSDAVGTGDGRPGTPRRSGTGLPAATAATVLVLALAAGATVALDAVAVTSTESAAPSGPGGTVPDPVAVRWRAPAGDAVRDVRAAAGGVVVLRAAEVVGLDARTGAVRWTHGRSGVELDRLTVSPDRRTVVVTGYLDDDLRDDRDRLVTVLDAATGAPRWTEPVVDEPMHVTDTLLTLTSGPAGDGRVTAPLVARSLDTGRALWSAAPDPRCEFRAVPTVAAAVVLQDCPGPLGGPRRVRSVRALDPVDGTARWTSAPVPVDPSSTGTGELPVAADGRTVVVDQPDTGPVVLDVGDATVRAGRSSGVRFDLVGDGHIAELGREGAAVRILGEDGRPVPVPVADPCDTGATPKAFGVVAGRPVLLCAGSDGRFGVRVPGRPAVPLGRLAGGDGSVTVDAGWIVPVPGAVVVAASPLSPGVPGPEVVGLGS